jgi:hypothetical protein
VQLCASARHAAIEIINKIVFIGKKVKVKQTAKKPKKKTQRKSVRVTGKNLLRPHVHRSLPAYGNKLPA